MSPDRITYRFGPLERRGLLGPVRGGQALMLGAGAIVAILALDLSPSLPSVLLGTIVFGLCSALAFAPVAGRTAEEWAPVVISFLGSGVAGRRSFRSTAPLQGFTWRSARQVARPRPTFPRTGRLEGPRPSPPSAFCGVELRELPYRGRPVGTICEQRGRWMTAVLACRATSFMLLDPEAQERRLARWGLLLAGTADTSIRRLQWVERTGPAPADQLASWFQEARAPDTPLRGTPSVDSYLELIGGGAQVAQEHEILLAVQVDTAGPRERRDPQAEPVLIEETERVARGLEAADVHVLGALGCRQLARVLRTGFDPFARNELDVLAAGDRAWEGPESVNAWPVGMRESWDRLACDGSLHVTYWIGGWPRVEVSPLFMDAMLGTSDVVRTMSVTFAPISPLRSTREIEAAITRDRADRELRRRFGQGETARHRLVQDAAARREAEIAAGHCEVRLAGYVTVSGRDDAELRHGCVRVLEHAARARLELHRLYGQQASAFAFTLPLARGLR